MTKEVKFPGTDVEAPKAILLEVEVKDNGSKIFHAHQSCMESEVGEFLEYLRADTVTHNDLVKEMMRQIYYAGENFAVGGELRSDHEVDFLINEILDVVREPLCTQ